MEYNQPGFFWRVSGYPAGAEMHHGQLRGNGQSLITAQIQTLHIGLGHSVSKWLFDIR